MEKRPMFGKDPFGGLENVRRTREVLPKGKECVVEQNNHDPWIDNVVCLDTKLRPCKKKNK